LIVCDYKPGKGSRWHFVLKNPGKNFKKFQRKENYFKKCREELPHKRVRYKIFRGDHFASSNHGTDRVRILFWRTPVIGCSHPDHENIRRSGKTRQTYTLPVSGVVIPARGA
jgi:hypothetical protein